MTQTQIRPFWERKKLSEMNKEEWESLCDGCARCCLHKLEDEETGEVHYTRIACHLLDLNKCSCTSYQKRSHLVPNCVVLNTDKLQSEAQWMPKSCAYRLLAEGHSLKWWHPLVSKNSQTVHESGTSIREKAIPEQDIDIDKLEDYMISDQE